MENTKRKDKPKGLDIIIVGCGKLGSALVGRLISDNHDITVIDRSSTVIQEITDRYDVSGIVGNGASFSVLQEAGVETADVLIAVTASDELNLLCCVFAKRAGKCDVIARVRTPEYVKESDYLKEQMGLAMTINPDLQAATAIARILFTPSALFVDTFAGGHADMIRLKLSQDNILIGKRIMDLDERLRNAMLICAVNREGEVFIPDGSSVLRAGDEIAFITQMRNSAGFLSKMGFRSYQVHDTVLLGGGRTAYYLAKILIHAGVSVTILEKNTQRCLDLSVMVPEAVVINGDASNLDQLKEIGIDSAGSIVALTNMDEENILLTMQAKYETGAKLVTKVDRLALRPVIQDLDLGSVVYPEYLTCEAISAFVRMKAAQMRSEIEMLVQIFDDQVEAIEFVVGTDSKVPGIPLSDLKLKDQVLITCINHCGQITIPRGSDVVQPGDTVIIVAKNVKISEIDDILA